MKFQVTGATGERPPTIDGGCRRGPQTAYERAIRDRITPDQTEVKLAAARPGGTRVLQRIFDVLPLEGAARREHAERVILVSPKPAGRRRIQAANRRIDFVSAKMYRLATRNQVTLDPAYNASQRLFNCIGRLLSQPEETISRFSDLLEVDAERVKLWIFSRLLVDYRDTSEPMLDLARKLRP